MNTARFWKDLGERTIGTFAGAMLAALGTGAAGITEMPWLDALNIGAAAAAITILKCMLATGVGSSDSASLVPSV